jgi:hypothetical protein
MEFSHAETIFERIVKARLKEKFANSEDQHERAAKDLVANTVNLATLVVSPFWKEVKKRNNSLALMILKAKSIQEAVEIHKDEFHYVNGGGRMADIRVAYTPRRIDFGRTYFRVYRRKLIPYLQSIGF